MTRKTAKPRSRLKLTATEAQAIVADIVASCTYYTEKLGFEVVFVAGEPPAYAQVARDRAKLNLRAIDEPVFAGDVRERERLLAASFTVARTEEIEQLFVTYRTAGVRFAAELTTESWGARNFIVVDPDGNLLLFAGPAE